jgi:hypothetical protein
MRGGVSRVGVHEAVPAWSVSFAGSLGDSGDEGSCVDRCRVSFRGA